MGTVFVDFSETNGRISGIVNISDTVFGIGI